MSCTETVSKPLRFEPLEICLSEKQTPQVVVFIRRGQNWCEALEPACVRPRQVRYQAALRPDSFASLILNHFNKSNHGAMLTFNAIPAEKSCQTIR